MTRDDVQECVSRIKGLTLRGKMARARVEQLMENGNDASAAMARAAESMLDLAKRELSGAVTNLCHDEFARASLADVVPAEHLSDALGEVAEDLAYLPSAYRRSEAFVVDCELGKVEDHVEVACFLLQRVENRLNDADAANV